jgi:hypothetical protein
MPLIKDDYIHAAVIRPALGAVVAGNGNGIGETGNLKPFFIYAQIGKVMEYVD